MYTVFLIIPLHGEHSISHNLHNSLHRRSPALPDAEEVSAGREVKAAAFQVHSCLLPPTFSHATLHVH